MKFYPRFVGDFLKKTAALTLAEKGAYNALLDHCYATEEPLPAMIERVWAIAGARTEMEKKAVENVLKLYFHKNGTGWVNPRAVEEIGKWRAKSHKAKESANKRWQKQESAK